MAESVVALLLNKLSTLFQQEYAHLEGLQREVQFIKDELGSMRAFLKEAEAKEDYHDLDSELQEWVKQVREVAYNTEEVLDEFILQFGCHRAGGFYGRVQKIYISIKTLRARHKVSTQIKDIKYRVECISDRHMRYKLQNSTTESGSNSSTVVGDDEQYDIRGHALLLEEASLVGIDKPKHQLISHILDDQSHLKVVSVVGMGGLGKTTLVKRVYEDGIVKKNFSTRAWVTVSQSLQIKQLFKDLVRQLYKGIQEQVPPEVEPMDGHHLRAFVKEFLGKKKFIIILDDVWNINSWDEIKYALPDGNCGSRILLTTRIADVAYTSSKESCGHVYQMKHLSVEESWNLFCKKTFEDNYCPPHLEQVSRSILSKCDGLPLAIVGIGGILALKDRSRQDEWEILSCSLGDELDGTGKLSRVQKILLLSYNDLPHHLKICLLYTSIFPEDYTIHVPRLVRLWVSEGFVQERKGMTTRKVGEWYLNELINRSLIQVVEFDDAGSPFGCSIHDLLREIICCKSEKYNITTVVTDRHTKWPDNARRLAVHDFSDNAQGFKSKHLQSFLLFGYTNSLSSSSLSELLCDGAKLLKVLDLEDVGLKDIPKKVFKLFHLKHLNLAGNPIEVIPRSIGKLHNLEYLNIVDTNVTELPIDILKLGKLREICAYHIADYSKKFAVRGFKAPYEIGQLLSLEILCDIDADNEKVVREVGKLTQLRKLGISKLRSKDGKELCASLEKLTNLRTLCVSSIKEDEILDLQHSMFPTHRFLQCLDLEGPLEKLPQWVRSLQGLTRLSLWRSSLIEDPLESLQDLPNLALLILDGAYEGETLRFKARRFQKLKRLVLFRLKKLKWIIIEEGTMTNLNELDISNCKLVEEPPQGIQNLIKLQNLGLKEMSNELITKLQDRESVDYRNMAHIPNIGFGNWVNGGWEYHFL